MKTKHKYKLIDGEFDPCEARSVLLTLVNSKINFHSMQSFGLTVRTSGDTSFHDKRILELTQTNTDIRALIDYAEKNKLHLSVDGTIEIKIIDASKQK
ncbi:MAG: hypothetical protein Q8T03_11485 [Bacteroidota bacterium]|nr:hypothetical protein [Bacteroidota bacterium]MDP3557984.1 hypothetical protein [Bacteroidota bacterium]